MSNKPVNPSASIEKSPRSKALHSFIIGIFLVSLAILLCPGQVFFNWLSKNTSEGFSFFLIIMSVNASALFLARSYSLWTGTKLKANSTMKKGLNRSSALIFDSEETARHHGIQFSNPIGRLGNQSIFETLSIGSETYCFEGIRHVLKMLEAKNDKNDLDSSNKIKSTTSLLNDAGLLMIGNLAYRLQKNS